MSRTLLHATHEERVVTYMGRVCLLALVLSAPVLAGEYAVLATGALLYADRHERDGAKVRLFRNQGVIELEAAAVLRFERVEEAAPTAPAQVLAPPRDPRELVEAAARQYGGADFVSLVHSVARAESGYRPDAVSPKGAVGLMQLMPATARDLNADPHDPGQNADAGARYLRDLLLKYKDDPYQLRLALAAYNAGPGAVDRHRSVPPYPETLQYVDKVIQQYRKAER